MKATHAAEILHRMEATPQLLEQNWSVPRETGRFLHVMTLLLKARQICEVGTSIGYSTLWLAQAVEETGGRIETIEYFEGRQQQARSHIAEAGLSEYVRFHLGAALEVLKQFQAEGKTFDLVFIDAAKHEYLDYIRLLEPMMPTGACLIADNTRSHRAEMQDFLSYLEHSPQFDLAELETPNGQLLACKR